MNIFNYDFPCVAGFQVVLIPSYIFLKYLSLY